MEEGGMLQITQFYSPRTLIRLHPTVGTNLRFSQGTCTCVCGIQSANVQVVFDTQVPQSSVQFSTTLVERLQMSAFPATVTAWVQEGKLRVGPIVGVLCNPIWNAKQQTLQMSKQLPALEKLVQAATTQGGICYLFRLADVDFQNSSTIAYISSNGAWKRIKSPLPDAIYDQVISRKVERNPEYAVRRAKLSQVYGTKIFNDGFFDKLQVNEWMVKDPRLRKHVPNTSKYAKPVDASTFIQRHTVTYFKPVHGSLGLGIIRVTRSNDGNVYYDIKRQKQAPLRGKATTSMEAIKSIEKRLSTRPYLMQQGIVLAAYQNRPFDIRILLQKDGAGEWRRTKMFARIAKEGDITSNLSTGGEALPVDAVLQSVFHLNSKRKDCVRQIRKVTGLITEVIERESGNTFGELGIDLGLDENGTVWVIEINSKPWKSPTTEKGRQDLVDLAFQRPMQYAVYLSQQL